MSLTHGVGIAQHNAVQMVRDPAASESTPRDTGFCGELVTAIRRTIFGSINRVGVTSSGSGWSRVAYRYMMVG